MAKKISQMTEATEIKSGDISVVVQDGETKQFPLDLLATKSQADEYKTGVETQLADYEQEITNIKNQYDKELYTPTITVTNTSMVKTGQGDTVDYSASVEDGVVKSAILKGQTLVNIFQFTSEADFRNSDSLTLDEMAMVFTANGSYQNFWLKNNGLVKSNTSYLFIVDILENTLEYQSDVSDTSSILYLTSSPSGYNDDNFFTNGVSLTVNDLKKSRFIKKHTSNPTITGTESIVTRGFLGTGAKSGTLKFKMMVIEYQEGMENWDIPFFRGMQSVKMPVLTTSNEDGTKTNILTVNEDVELRGTGEMQDTLDCLTGEIVERIGEIVLDGSDDEIWSLNKSLGDGSYNQFIFFSAINAKKVAQQLVVCDKLASNIDENLNNVIWVYDGKTIVIHSGCASVNELKSWLQSNPITVQYELETESVKTVVLNPSGTLASETPYMWKNGSIQLSSDGLVPCLDYAVTTSRVGVIEDNMSKTITNEKRIHALEIMLAQSTISAATDAVSLQSDLETTTMTVDGAQLDTGNTQDDFLYEMILLLIEKDAYDETLFDKVCAFYLYGKLSDEQFTNIYSLLYPEYPEEE